MEFVSNILSILGSLIGLLFLVSSYNHGSMVPCTEN